MQQQPTAQYVPVYAKCACGCNYEGWIVCSVVGWRSQHAVNAVAAQLAANMLNAGRITEDELDVMWSVESDWGELLIAPSDDAIIPPHLH